MSWSILTKLVFVAAMVLFPSVCFAPMPYWSDYEPVYPAKIMRGPTGDYWLISPGGKVVKDERSE